MSLLINVPWNIFQEVYALIEDTKKKRKCPDPDKARLKLKLLLKDEEKYGKRTPPNFNRGIYINFKVFGSKALNHGLKKLASPAQSICNSTYSPAKALGI